MKLSERNWQHYHLDGRLQNAKFENCGQGFLSRVFSNFFKSKYCKHHHFITIKIITLPQMKSQTLKNVCIRPNIFELSSISDYIRPDSKKLYPVHPITDVPNQWCFILLGQKFKKLGKSLGKRILSDAFVCKAVLSDRSICLEQLIWMTQI